MNGARDTGKELPLPLREGEYGGPCQALLRLLAWLSPAFPTGAYAYSHGVEWAVECGDIADGDTLRVWLGDVLIHGSDPAAARAPRRQRPRGAERPRRGDRSVARASSRNARSRHGIRRGCGRMASVNALNLTT